MTANAKRYPVLILAMVGSLTLGFLRSSAAQCPIQLHEVGGETGIHFHHTDGSSGRRYIMETVTAGLALFDYDGDGLIDIYFVNGAPLKGTQTTETPRNALYRNEGGWKFRDVTEEAGVGDTGFGLGVAIADYDQDGIPTSTSPTSGRTCCTTTRVTGRFPRPPRRRVSRRATPSGPASRFSTSTPMETSTCTRPTM